MRIGIMSMQRVVNYGSFLQAYGLKKEIEKLGHQVEFVDYEVEPSLVIDKDISVRKNDGKVRRVLRMMSPQYRDYRKKQIKMNQTFSDFSNAYGKQFMPELGVGQTYNYQPQLDVLVIGSDEVFNCTQSGNLVGYSRQLFGKDNNAKKIISYAASFGSTTMEKLQKYGIANEVGTMLKKFDRISVRDDNSSYLVQELCGIIPHKHIDPVLLYEFPEVENIKVDLKNYIVVYAYADRIEEDEAKAIRKFAHDRNKIILTLGFCQPFSDEYRLVNPLEALAYVKNADYVITDTFHGTVFSIKYQVPFATIIRESNKQKLSDLLNSFVLENRQVWNLNDIPSILDSPIDCEMVKERLKSEQLKSREYLRTFL